MKRFVVLLSVSLGLVSIAYFFLNYTFRNAPWGIYKKFHQIFNDTAYYDVWIIGSSRAETAFETNLLSQKTNLKIFNAGIHGAKTQQSFYVLKHILHQHPSPQFILFDLDIHNLEYIDTILNIEQFAPFLSHQELRKNLSKIDSRITYAYYLPFYGITFYGLRGLSKSLRILSNKPGRYDTTFQISGCYHSHTDYQKDHYPDTTHPFKFHPFNLMYLDSIISICQKNNILLLATISPIYQPDFNLKNAAKFIQQYLQEKKIKCIDFTNIPDLSNNIFYFSDKYHIKFEGSVLFTNIVLDSLKQHLPKTMTNHLKR